MQSTVLRRQLSRNFLNFSLSYIDYASYCTSYSLAITYITLCNKREANTVLHIHFYSILVSHQVKTSY